MQFFPFLFTSSSPSALNGVSVAANKGFKSRAAQGNGFFEQFNEQRVAQDNEFLAQFSEQLAAKGVTPVFPQSGAPAQFRTVSLDTNSLKNEDLEVLRVSLKKRGLKDEQLNTLENLINSGQPITMGTLVSALSGNRRSAPPLAEEERQQLGSALRKMGFTQDETATLESMMDQGKSGAAMQAINRKLRVMDPESCVTLDKAEAQSLARGLELSDKASQKMMALFGKGEQPSPDKAETQSPARSPEHSDKASQKMMALFENGEQLSMNKEGLSALLAQANKEVAEKGQAVRALAKELRGAVDDTLKSAAFREATASDADTRASRRAERSETRINDTLTAKSNNLGPEALAERIRQQTKSGEESATAERQPAQNQAQNQEQSLEHDLEEDLEQNFTEMARKAAAARKEGGGEAAAARGEESRSRRSESGDAFSNVVAEGMFFSGPSSPSGAPSRPEGLNASVRQELFAQVEKGMLRELSDGSRQLTLHLNPEELGQLNVLLTVRQGEVRAVIRTDNEETTAALAQQMEQLKTSLEEQGLKVTQLEVETRLSDNAADKNWDGTAQYNQEQELREQARFFQLSRLRREAGDDLARNMQNTFVEAAPQEELSGLHLVA